MPKSQLRERIQGQESKFQIYVLLNLIKNIMTIHFEMIGGDPFWINWKHDGKRKWTGTPQDGRFPVEIEV